MNAQLIGERKKLGMTIAEAAEKIGISYGMLAMLESGKRKGSDTTKVKVSKYYKRSVGELFYNNY